MGILRSIATFPLSLPLSGTVWLARRLQEAAEAERADPSALRAALAELERRLEAGEIDEAAYEEAEVELLDLMDAAAEVRA